MKDKNQQTVGIVLLIIGIVGFFGLFTDTGMGIGSILLYIFTCAAFVAAGVFLLVYTKKQKNRDVPTTVSNIAKNQSDSEKEYNRKREEEKRHQEKFLLYKRTEFAHALAEIPRVNIPLSNQKVNRRQASDLPEINFSNITKRTPLEKLFPLVVLDVETTGLQVRGNDIIEVSAIKYDVGFRPVSCFTTLLKPRFPIPAEATAVNHITDDMVKDCPAFSAVAPAFSDYIAGCSIVGHNVLFDLKFLFVCGATLPEKVRYFDTLKLAKLTLTSAKTRQYDHHAREYYLVEDYDVDDYKLETLCEYYNIYRDDAHRSLSDCLATGMLFENLIEDKIGD